MIIGWIGSQGSYKTASMENVCYVYHNQFGYVIITNMELNYPHEKLNEELFKDSEAIEKLKKKYGHSRFIIAVDEIHLLMDSRQTSINAKAGKTFIISQARKMLEENGHLLYTTQYFNQIDIRLRMNTAFIIQCTVEMVNFQEVIYWRLYKENYKGELQLYRKMAIPKEFFTLGRYEQFQLIESSEDYKR